MYIHNITDSRDFSYILLCCTDYCVFPLWVGNTSTTIIPSKGFCNDKVCCLQGQGKEGIIYLSSLHIQKSCFLYIKSTPLPSINITLILFIIPIFSNLFPQLWCLCIELFIFPFRHLKANLWLSAGNQSSTDYCAILSKALQNTLIFFIFFL